MKMPVVRLFSWVLKKFWRAAYEKIVVNRSSLKNFRKFTEETNAPIVIVPTHKSLIDYLLISYVLFTYKIRVPYMVSSKHFLKVSLVNHILRWSGAFL